MHKYVWNIKIRSINKKNDKWLTDVLAKNRGLNSQYKLKKFLNPDLTQILETEITDTKKAVSRIVQAIEEKEKIIVYSDYDADGICATAIMWETLYDLDADVLPYVPDRVKEGYGLSALAIEKLAADNVKLIITVDHGVTAKDQVAFAKKLGVDVIISDHHVLPPKLPKAYAMVHTTNLCGAGVSWLLCYHIVKKLKPSYLNNLYQKLELAAIATIADLVPLIGANRAIVKIGLEKLAKTERFGIKALIGESGINGRVGTYEIGHILAPRINAMGRIEHGLDALRLLCARNRKQAEILAKFLAKTNSRRRDLTVKAIDHARGMVKEDESVSVISHESWHEGIIGLVASRLVESFNKPVIVISKKRDFSKGSARSIPGFNIIEAIRASSEFLVDGGGHPMAAGFTIETKHITTFTQRINKYAESRLNEELLTLRLQIECELKLEDITPKTLKTVDLFKPFGIGNPEPVFVTREMTVEDIRGVGNLSEHLKLQLGGISAIGFGMGDLRSMIRPGYKVNAAYTLSEDNYNGNGAIQLKLKDLRLNNS